MEYKVTKLTERTKQIVNKILENVNKMDSQEFLEIKISYEEIEDRELMAAVGRIHLYEELEETFGVRKGDDFYTLSISKIIQMINK